MDFIKTGKALVVFSFFLFPSLNSPALQSSEPVDSQTKLMKSLIQSDTTGYLMLSSCARSLVSNAVKSGRFSEARKIVFDAFVKNALTISKDDFFSEETQRTRVLSDVFRLIELCEAVKDEAWEHQDAISWILSSEQKLSIFINLISQNDDFVEAIDIIEKIIKYDAKECDQFSNLIFALSVVWDQKRPFTHSQVSTVSKLPVSKDIINRYEYFKLIFKKRRSKFYYKHLTATDLVYVVDTPMPVSELNWVYKNISGSLSKWGQKYSSIKYDYARLNIGQYTWAAYKGRYTLANILKQGGICVDQAYYATMTARAYGIPAMYFSGDGRNAGHAWFSYKKNRNSWAMDIGRYKSDNYTVGDGIHPQTNKRITDRDMELLYTRSNRQQSYKIAMLYVEIAKILSLERMRNKAESFCLRAIKLFPLKLEAWVFMETRYTYDKRWEQLFTLLQQKESAFRKFPDIVANTIRYQFRVLHLTGKHDEADLLLRRAKLKVRGGRDDLQRSIHLEHVNSLIFDKKYLKARKYMEKVLRSQKNEMMKLLNFLQKYLYVTAKSGQTSEAVEFIVPYINSLMSNVDSKSGKKSLRKCIVKAYQNNNDVKAAAQIKKKYSI